MNGAPDPGRQGRVWLVGAGPGDPELLTLRAVRALACADVVLYDRLVAAAVLDLARPDAAREYVGKDSGDHGVDQAAISARLIELARAGKHVVRLKGGDPFVFGRGGEELRALRAQGIAYEVIPGVTAAVACAAYAGIPLTQRGTSQQVSFVTAHCEASLDALDWRALARARHTLALYMGVARIPEIRRQLLRHGRAAQTPAAIVENGTTPQQRVIVTTLNALAAAAERNAVRAPAMIFIGEVAALAADLAWFGSVTDERLKTSPVALANLMSLERVA